MGNTLIVSHLKSKNDDSEMAISTFYGLNKETEDNLLKILQQHHTMKEFKHNFDIKRRDGISDGFVFDRNNQLNLYGDIYNITRESGNPRFYYRSGICIKRDEGKFLKFQCDGNVLSNISYYESQEHCLHGVNILQKRPWFNETEFSCTKADNDPTSVGVLVYVILTTIFLLTVLITLIVKQNRRIRKAKSSSGQSKRRKSENQNQRVRTFSNASISTIDSEMDDFVMGKSTSDEFIQEQECILNDYRELQEITVPSSSNKKKAKKRLN